MANITKDEQIRAVAAAAGITSRQARDAIDAVVGVVTAGLVEGEQIMLHGLGRFAVHVRGPRRVMNPATGVMMDLPAKHVVKFHPSRQLREHVVERGR